jgi:hypothetical protein
VRFKIFGMDSKQCIMGFTGAPARIRLGPDSTFSFKQYEQPDDPANSPSRILLEAEGEQLAQNRVGKTTLLVPSQRSYWLLKI